MEYCRQDFCTVFPAWILHWNNAGKGYIIFSFTNMEVEGEQFSVCL